MLYAFSELAQYHAGMQMRLPSLPGGRTRGWKGSREGLNRLSSGRSILQAAHRREQCRQFAAQASPPKSSNCSCSCMLMVQQYPPALHTQRCQ
jgi:hypothetical protein